MSEQTFDAFTRRAANAVSRRSSLAALSGVALAAGLLAQTTSAAKDNKAKKTKKKARKKCKRQVDQCLDALPSVCEAVFGPADVPECVLFFDECCEPLRGCNVSEAAACLVQRINQI
jgi:hypothetical protein